MSEKEAHSFRCRKEREFQSLCVDLNHIDLLFYIFPSETDQELCCTFKKVYITVFFEKSQIYGRTSEFCVLALRIPLQRVC
jgi:hypothetical protein